LHALTILAEHEKVSPSNVEEVGDRLLDADLDTVKCEVFDVEGEEVPD
jgi:hypothetical protein